MFPTLSLGPVSLPVPELILLIGFWIGSTWAERRAPRFNVPSKELGNLLLLSLAAGLLGGRAAYVFSNLLSFQGNLGSIFSLNPNLIDLQAGLSIAVFSAWVYASQKRLEPWSCLDALTPFFCVLYLTISLHFFAAGSRFGIPTVLPWGIQLWGTVRHPVQLYHALGALIIILAFYFEPAEKARLPGSSFLLYCAAISFSMVIALGFQQTDRVIGPGLRLNQLAAWIIFCASGILYLTHLSTRKRYS